MTQGRLIKSLGLWTVALSCALPAVACIKPMMATSRDGILSVWAESCGEDAGVREVVPTITARTGAFTISFVLDLPATSELYELQPRAEVNLDNSRERLDWLMDQVLAGPAHEFVRPLINPAMALGQAALLTP